MKTSTVYISSDPLTLGPSATQDDLDTYAQNLANHLAKLFPDNTFKVEQKVGGGRTPCPENDEVNELFQNWKNGAVPGWKCMVSRH